MNSIGFLDYLLLTAALAMSWRMYHAAHPPPQGTDTAPSPAASAQAEPPPPRAAAVAAGPFDAVLRSIFGGGGATGTLASFLDGARLSYELAVSAFAAGDLREHAYLLTEEVGGIFAEAIAERRRRGETASLTFIGFRSTDIVGAGIEAGRAWIDVRFVAQIVAVSRNAEGRVVAGDPTRVVEAAELWTFERDLASSEPGWVVAATEADE